jgi:hypothetical protein
MHDRINRTRLEQLVKASAIRQVAYHQVSFFRHSLTVAATQVIEDDDLVSCLQ